MGRISLHGQLMLACFFWLQCLVIFRWALSYATAQLALHFATAHGPPHTGYVAPFPFLSTQRRRTLAIPHHLDLAPLAAGYAN